MKEQRKFDVGKMRHRIAVYAINRQDDEHGGFDRNDPTGGDLIGRFWCKIYPVMGMERQWGEQFTEVTTHMCWLRYNSLLKEGMLLRRILTDQTIDYYLERLVDPSNLKEFHVAMLREGGPL